MQFDIGYWIFKSPRLGFQKQNQKIWRTIGLYICTAHRWFISCNISLNWLNRSSCIPQCFWMSYYFRWLVGANNHDNIYHPIIFPICHSLINGSVYVVYKIKIETDIFLWWHPDYNYVEYCIKIRLFRCGHIFN